MYLPEGDWVDYYTGERRSSRGQWLKKNPIARNGAYWLPLFLRAAAIIPLMHVDEQTMNISGACLDGSVRDEIILRMVADAQTSEFLL